jgi:oxygen-independent coproporphyrinogen-3 oxidase
MADAVQRGILSPIDDDASADFTELAMQLLGDAGWVHYEIANWSATAEKASVHNTLYWRNGDYAGLGAGAHGRVAGMRTMNHPSPRTYIDALRTGHSPISNSETISEQTAMAETMMLGLRLLRDGIAPEAFRLRHGVSIDDQFGPKLFRLNDIGLLDIRHDRVRLTERGALLANSVCAEFL